MSLWVSRWESRLRTNLGTVASLDEAVTVLGSTERRQGKTVIRPVA